MADRDDEGPEVPAELLAAFGAVTAITGLLRAFFVACVGDGFTEDQAMVLTVNYMQTMQALAFNQKPSS